MVMLPPFYALNIFFGGNYGRYYKNKTYVV